MTFCHILPERRGWVNRISCIQTFEYITRCLKTNNQKWIVISDISIWLILNGMSTLLRLRYAKSRENSSFFVYLFLKSFFSHKYSYLMLFTNPFALAGYDTRSIFKRRQIYLILFTNTSALAGYDTRSIFKRSLTGFNSEFSFSLTSCLTKAEELSLPYYLPIAGGRIIGFIPFPRLLALCEMLSVSSRIWTRVAVSISYDDNHYTTGTSYLIQIICAEVWFQV